MGTLVSLKAVAAARGGRTDVSGAGNIPAGVDNVVQLPTNVLGELSDVEVWRVGFVQHLDALDEH